MSYNTAGKNKPKQKMFILRVVEINYCGLHNDDDDDDNGE